MVDCYGVCVSFNPDPLLRFQKRGVLGSCFIVLLEVDLWVDIDISITRPTV